MIDDDFLTTFDPFQADSLLDFDFMASNPFDLLGQDAAPVQTKAQLNAPIVHSRRAAKRQHVINLKRESLAQLITRLPDVDEVMYVVGNGTGREGRMGATLDATGFDYGSFVPVLADMMGRGAILHISTWVMNRDTANEFVKMLDDGRLAALYLLTDPYFKAKPSTAPIANTLIAEFARHAPHARFLAFANHTKILCMASAASDRHVTITGSSNLTAVQRCEQYALDGSPDTYRFFVEQFFEPMLKAAERK